MTVRKDAKAKTPAKKDDAEAPPKRKRGNPNFVPGNKLGRGRPKGSKNKGAMLIDALNESGYDFIAEFTRLLNSPDIPDKDKLKTMAQLSAYVFSKPEKEVSITEDKAITIEVKGLSNTLTDDRRRELEGSLGVDAVDATYEEVKKDALEDHRHTGK